MSRYRDETQRDFERHQRADEDVYFDIEASRVAALLAECVGSFSERCDHLINNGVSWIDAPVFVREFGREVKSE